MIKRILILSLLFLSLAEITQARQLSDLKIQAVPITEMRQLCESEISFGCFNPNNQTITIADTYTGAFLQFVIWHEVGHFLLQDTECSTIQIAFPSTTCHQSNEMAANSFYDFALLPINKVPITTINFWKNVFVDWNL